MSDEKKPFSLGDFYAKRQPSAERDAAIPRFDVRVPEAMPATTDVGVTRSPLPSWRMHREQRERPAAKLGGPVYVVRSACLSWQGTPCWKCSEVCPIEETITLDAGRPVIDAARCDGCGECVAVCPAPHNALKLVAQEAKA